MNEELLKEISEKLDKLIALTATQGMGIDEKIKVLKNLGFNNVQIGKFVGITEGGVRSRLKGK